MNRPNETSWRIRPVNAICNQLSPLIRTHIFARLGQTGRRAHARAGELHHKRDTVAREEDAPNSLGTEVQAVVCPDPRCHVRKDIVVLRDERAGREEDQLGWVSV
jgi:hypothetical protein